MGIYDTYGDEGVQMKVSNDDLLGLGHFKIGRLVPLDDGIYVGGEGILVIHGHHLVAVHQEIKDKWGGTVDLSQWLRDHNPVMQAITQMTNARYRKKESRWKRLLRSLRR